MTFLVPFDGSELSTAALDRAGEYGAKLEADVTVVSVIPNGPEYAREKGWIQPDEPFAYEAVVEELRSRVASLAPDATFRPVRVDRYARTGSIVLRIRRVAGEIDAAVVFIGSENAGRIVTSVSSVGGGVTTELSYDVHIVRRAVPPKIPTLSPDERPNRSDGIERPIDGE